MRVSANQIARRRARARRDRWARKFQPVSVRLLLIAEAPPAALDRYFYFPNVPTHDSLFREIAKVLLSTEPTRKNKRELLEQLCEAGVFLIDAVREPVDDRYSVDLGRLIARIRRLAPERVIVLKVGVFDKVYDAVSDAGVPIVPIRIPFPGSGQQVKFRREFKRALAQRF